MESGDPLVSATWLKENFTAPDLKIVDATWVPPFLTGRDSGRDSFEKAHISGAVYFDIDEIADHESSLSHMLPSPEAFSAHVSKLGLGDGHRIVVYDSNGFFASARVWWMFRAMGYSNVKVLDGGLKAWEAVSGAMDDIQTIPPVRSFTARKRDELVRDMDQMRRHVESRDTKVLDARDAGRFNGTSPEPRKGLPSGHMPGSFCVPAFSLLTKNGLMKSADELSVILSEFKTGPVITTCGSGVSAAIIALALARIGIYDAAVYDGSWSEWAANSENPIATTT